MANFSPFERTIAKILSKLPWLKKIAKKSYSRFMYILNKPANKVVSNTKITILNRGLNETFFGYYDKSPVNSSSLVLLNSTKENSYTKSLPSDKSINIEVYSKKTKEIILSTATTAYNWQQGARSHWLSDDKFVFNDYDEKEQQYCAKIYSVSKNNELQRLSYPVQDSFYPDFYLSINYERLMALRPDYGYRNRATLSKSEIANIDDDGVWRVNFKTGEAELIISIAELCDLFPMSDVFDAKHKFNHVMISPDGEKFIFMHRLLINGQRFDRLFVCNNEGKNIKLISDNNMVSHCFWRDNQTIFGYLRGADGRDAYWLINVITGEFTEFENSLLSKQGDGHPNVYGDYFITDTYPDKARMQKLLLGNFKTGEVKVLGEFFHGFEYKGETRCDLHPRFAIDGKSVFFDTVYSGKRQLCELEVTLD